MPTCVPYNLVTSAGQPVRHRTFSVPCSSEIVCYIAGDDQNRLAVREGDKVRRCAAAHGRSAWRVRRYQGATLITQGAYSRRTVSRATAAVLLFRTVSRSQARLSKCLTLSPCQGVMTVPSHQRERTTRNRGHQLARQAVSRPSASIARNVSWGSASITNARPQGRPS